MKKAEMPLSPELTSRILSWGSDCEVVRPVDLREEVYGDLEKTLKNYRDPD